MCGLQSEKRKKYIWYRHAKKCNYFLCTFPSRIREAKAKAKAKAPLLLVVAQAQEEKPEFPDQSQLIPLIRETRIEKLIENITFTFLLSHDMNKNKHNRESESTSLCFTLACAGAVKSAQCVAVVPISSLLTRAVVVEKDCPDVSLLMLTLMPHK